MIHAVVVFLSAVGTTASIEVSFDDEASLCLLQKAAAVRPVWHSVDLNPAPEHLFDLEVDTFRDQELAQGDEGVMSLASESVAFKPEVSSPIKAEWHSVDLNPAPQHAILDGALSNAALSLSSASTAVMPQWHSPDPPQHDVATVVARESAMVNAAPQHAAAAAAAVAPESVAVSLATGSTDLNIQDAADSAALSEDGYSAVAALGNRELMRAYVRRVAKDEGLRISNEGALSGALAYYTGECSTQSYAALVRELYRGTETAKCKQAWVEHVKPSSLLQTSSFPHVSASHRKLHSGASSSTEKDEPDSTWHWAEDLEDSLGVLENELMNLKTAVMDNEEKELMKLNAGEVKSNHIEQKISLDQAGYEQVAAKGNTTEMALFTRHVAEHEGFKVTNAKPLAGMSRYYSGECATQSFQALVNELHRVAGRRHGRCGGGPWLIEQ